MPYKIIEASSDPATDTGYTGPLCAIAGVGPGRIYDGRGEAEEDARRLAAAGSRGFAVHPVDFDHKAHLAQARRRQIASFSDEYLLRSREAFMKTKARFEEAGHPLPALLADEIEWYGAEAAGRGLPVDGLPASHPV